MTKITYEKSNKTFILIMMVILITLYTISRYNYLVTHTIIEFAIATIGVMIFIITIKAKTFKDNNMLVMMGPGFLVSSVLGMLHLMTFENMFVFNTNSSNISIQLWVLLSLILAFAFLSSTIEYSKKINYSILLLINVIIALVFCILIFTGNFPDCYIDGIGLTMFKKTIEYIIICIYIISLFRINRSFKDEKIDAYNYKTLKTIVFLLVLAEMSLTLYFHLQGIFNILGHFLKFIGFILIYNNLLSDLIINPYKRASFNNDHDYLTGLFNRKYLEELLITLNTKDNLPLVVTVFDIDSLKLFNDAYGNETGDQIIKKVANTLENHTNINDYLFRSGGDEFIVISPRCNESTKSNMVRVYFDNLNKIKVKGINVKVSYGFCIKTKIDSTLSKILTRAEDDMNKNKLVNGIGVRGEVVNSIIKTLHEKNPREEAHSKRVGLISYKFGEKLGLTSREKNRLKMMGLLHDVGKIGLDENILNKTSRLTEEEYEEVKKHPEIGYRILCSANNLSEIAELVLAHHERWDGNGYPRGLFKEEIPYLTRILTIVDSYDAMTSNRTYRKGMEKEEIFKELKIATGKQFDPELMPMFLELLLENPNI